MQSRLVTACALAHILVLAGLGATARAEMASPWDESLSSRVRLLAGSVAVPPGPGEQGTGDLFLGVEIRIDDGFKTYWRNPGDAGIPPRFDWSRSVNVKSAEVLYPAPSRLADPAGQTLGYKHAVLFPIRLVREDDGAPADVQLKLSYAVCGTLCIPAEANLAIRLPAAADAGAGPSLAIEQGLARVPRRHDGQRLAALGDDRAAPAPALPRVDTVRLEEGSGGRRLSITVAQPSGARAGDLFVEGPPDWYLPLANATARRQNGAIEEVDDLVALDGIPASAALTGTMLKFTIVGGGAAAEQDWTLR